MKKYNAPLGASLVVLSSFFYGTYGVWTKLMGDFFQGYTASALRSVVVLATLLPIALSYRQLQPLSLRQNGRYIAGMVAASLLTWGPLYYAILHAGIGIGISVFYASTVMSSFVFGWLLAGERLTKDKLISAGLGIVGLGLIFSPTTAGVAWLALAGAVVSGLSTGAMMVCTKQIHYNATQSTLAAWTASVLANVVMALVLHEPRPAVGWHLEWLYLALFAVASVIASWSLTKGVKLIDAGAAGILGLLEIVFGVFFGMVFFHENPSATALLGITIIIAAAAIPYIKDYNAKRGTLD